MPLKFAMEEKPVVETEQHVTDHAPDLDAFRASVLTMRGLGELYQESKARVERGQQYLETNVRLPLVRAWLTEVWGLDYADARAPGILQRVAKAQPGLTQAVDLMVELRAKLAELDRRVTAEAELQHALEQRLTGGVPGRYVCTHCWRVVGEHGQCRCWEARDDD